MSTDFTTGLVIGLASASNQTQVSSGQSQSNQTQLKPGMCEMFLRVDNTSYNMVFAKMIQCTDQKCTMTFANTNSVGGGNWSVREADQIYECQKKKDPECYKKLWNFVQSCD